MNRNSFFCSISAVFLLFLVSGNRAYCNLADFTFTEGSGSAISMDDAIQAMGPGIDNETVGTFPIGFNFDFDGTLYSEFSVSSNGWITLGSTTPRRGDQSNAFDDKASYPVITAFWDNLLTTADAAGGIFYKTEGQPGEQVLTIEFRMEHANRDVSGPYYYQVRLYEGSHKIEFFYISMPGNAATGGTIGAAVGERNFVSITPGVPATISSEEANNSVNLRRVTIEDNTLYTLRRCEQDQVAIAGDIAEGGTERMSSGDRLFESVSVKRGSFQEFRPFTISLGPLACESREFSYSISGTDADNYRITPESGVLGERESNTPVITFTPDRVGQTSATLTVSDDNGFRRSYTLVAIGETRIDWVGNVAQGGTVAMADNDVLMQNLEVRRLESETFTPFSVTNTNKDPLADPTLVTYQLIDPTGQYTIDRTSDELSGGEVSMPAITFAPTETGSQTAQLVVTTEDGVRHFTLRAYAVAPAAIFSINSQPIVSGNPLFRNVVTCVGSPTSYQVTVTNVNRVDVEITGSNIYATESQVQQGSPRYPILRNAFGERVQSLDYFLTENPGVAPYTANSFLQYPLVVKPGETKTFYVTYMPTRKGIRYGRLFLYTNGENFTGTEIGSFDREGEGIEEVEGLLTVDLFGKSVGGAIAGVSGTKLPEPLVFETLDPNTSSLKSAVIRNSGDCDLRINSTKLRIGAGDLQDFEIVSALANTSIDPTTRDFILPPGGVDSIVVKFSPVRSGSRRATIELKTNDSALYIEGVAERGSYYLDLYGVGASGLDVASSITLPPAVIDGPGSTGTVKFENSSVEPITINSIVITGGSTEIVEDPSSLWPSFPVTIGAADELELEVAFDPTSGSAPGSRTATMQVVLSDGRIVDIVLNGTAGTRLIATPRPTLFGSSEVAVGEIKREVAVITNNGTFPLEIQDMMIVGGGASDYRVNPLPRAIIAPGGSEFVEVTYTPQAEGNSVATLTITSNATNGIPAGTLEIALGGTAVPATSGGVVDPSGNATGLPGEGATTIASRGSASESNATSSVSSSAQGIVNLQNMPNPAQVETTIVFTLGTSSEAIINLYNAEGRLVKTLLSRELGAGTHEVVCDLSNLPSGQYFYQLTANGTVAGHGLQITK